MKKIRLTEEQLNRLVETTTVFKDEHKMKEDVDSELGEQSQAIARAIKKAEEDSEKCECKCNEDGKDCKCPPECTKCDCGKKKLKEGNESEEGELPFSLNNSFFGVMADILVEIGYHHNNPEISLLTNFLSHLHDVHSRELQDIRIKNEILIDSWNSIQSESEKSSDQEETSEDWNPNASVGTQPGGLMQGAHFPKWIQENKNNFKRLIK